MSGSIHHPNKRGDETLTRQRSRRKRVFTKGREQKQYLLQGERNRKQHRTEERLIKVASSAKKEGGKRHLQKGREKKVSSHKKRRGKVAPIHRRRESSTVHKKEEEEEKATPVHKEKEEKEKATSVHKEGGAPFGWCCLFLLFVGESAFPLLLLWSGAAVFHEKQAKQQLEVSRVNKLKTWKSKKRFF